MIKTAQIANLNITFGDNETPMLNFFDTVIFPALTAGIIRRSSDDHYMFKEIAIEQDETETYILKGKLVKKTTLEIKSDLDENGELIKKDEHHSAAPYSSFIVNLRNHRVIFMPNQKGSPTLANFKSTLCYVIDKYIESENEKRSEENKIDEPIIKVVGVPSVRSMDELLQDVDKIQCLTLRFYPLNGDLDYSEAFGIVTNDTRKTLDSKTGSIIFRSPKSIEGVKKILAAAAGTICPILKVKTKNGSTATLNDDQLSEKYDLEMGDSVNAEDMPHLYDRMKDISSMNYTNERHDKIYSENISKIQHFFKKGRD